MAATEHQRAARERRRKASRRAFVDAVLAGVPIEPYGLEVAVAHTERLAHTRKAARGLQDRSRCSR